MTDTNESTSEIKDILALHDEWDAISCPICMDHPHNAVLIICSSHEKGCRSYICDTSYRHSNCLDRFKKLKPNNCDVNPSQPSSSLSRNLVERQESQESNDEENSLKCPLCRGNVLGWMIIKEAREYLDLKQRSCSRESCSFSANYRELRRHARRVHPTTRPADVDPSRARAWHHLEHQSEFGDVISAIRSEMPGALVLGDYVIETGEESFGGQSGPWWTSNLFLFNMIDSPLRSLGEPRGRTWRTHRRAHLDDDRPIPRRRRRFTRSRSNEERP